MMEMDIEVCRITVAQGISEDGHMVYNTRWSGDVPCSTMIGLLELAKIQILREHGQLHGATAAGDDDDE